MILQQILVIHEPFWIDSGANLWFTNHSEMILGWISVIYEPFWNDSAVNHSGANLSDSWNILKWFWGKSQWFVNHSKMILEWILVFVNHSEMILGWILVTYEFILEWISVIYEPFWNDSGVNCGGVNLSDSQTGHLYITTYQALILLMNELLENHFRMFHESLRFTPESFQNGSWITKICSRIILEWFVNHWDSFKNNFRMVDESLRFTWKSFQIGLQITKIH